MSDSAGSISPGTVVLYAGMWTNFYLTEDWLMCDQSLLLQEDWPALFSAIGRRYSFFFDPLDSFRLPGYPEYQIRYTTTANAGFDFSGYPSTHSHTLYSDPFVNAMTSESGHTHANSGTTTSSGINHSHLPNVLAGGNNAGNVGRAVGNANTHGVGHSHNVTAAVGGGGNHNHNIGVVSNTNTGHNHTAPLLSTVSINGVDLVTYGNGSTAQPTIDMWYIIKT